MKRKSNAAERAVNMFDHARDQKVQEGERLKAEAIDRVDKANQFWVERAIQVAKRVATEKKAKVPFFENADVYLTADDIYPAMGGLICTENRAMGAVMKHLADAGIIEYTERTVRSVRPECHRRPIRVWRVL